MKSYPEKFTAALILLIFLTATMRAQTTEFTYQGKLNNGAAAANGNYDFEFRLFDAPTGGTELGVQQQLNVVVTNGIFAVTLDFGAANFSGANRWLAIAVRQSGGGAFTILTPRQALTSSPYSIKSLLADNASRLGGIDADEYVTTTGGGVNFILNTTASQTANFSISGDGTAGGTLSGVILNAVTQYNLGGLRILSNAGQRNLFAGEGAGQANTGDGSNAFFGYRAGFRNTVGVRNNFFGSVAGENTLGGSDNNFFGDSAGRFNTSGRNNSYFGSFAGQNNTVGDDNALFGYQAGLNNSGSENAFFGGSSGDSNTSGRENTFIGYGAGTANTTGIGNTFVGSRSAVSQVSGLNNTALGTSANVLSGLTYATAIGAEASVAQSNSIVLGRSNALDSVGIGLSNPVRLLDVNGRARIRSIPLEASTSAVCFNAAGDLLQCGASSLRFKENIQPFSDGLNILRRLRPISFNWMNDGVFDIGLAAEEVNEAAPFFSLFDAQGKVSGVRYDRLNLLYINAFNEQQRQIEEQQKLILKQQEQLHELKNLVCLDRPNAEFCRRRENEK